MIDFKEYTKLRDIAQKRIKRAIAAGVKIDKTVATVKELRQRGEFAAEIEMMQLKQFLQTGFSLARRREETRPVLSESEKRAKKREQNRLYRRMKVAREYERPEWPTKYQSYLKGIETFNRKYREQGLYELVIDIPPRKLPAFFAYMDYRYSQGSYKDKKYMFDTFIEDYEQMLKAGYKADQILSDFKKFEADQALLSDSADQMEGTGYDLAAKRWHKFMKWDDII